MSKSSKKIHNLPPRQSSSSTQELIDPLWIVKAVGATIIVAAVCAYAAICALFWHGQWQIVLSPSRSISATPAAMGLPFEDVHFGPDSGGQPGLTGWWIPSTEAGAPTALVMHGGSGSMSDMLPQAHLLHDSRVNVFLFDYRGFGKSAGAHPSQQQMNRDTEAALDYLTDLRSIPLKNIIAFGEGLGASLATQLCAQHNDISALILESADGDLETRAVLDERSRMVPVGLLFNQKFPLADSLHTLATPKLLISYTKSATPRADFARAGDPKFVVEIGSPQDTSAYSASLQRFLDSYVTRPPTPLLPQMH